MNNSLNDNEVKILEIYLAFNQEVYERYFDKISAGDHSYTYDKYISEAKENFDNIKNQSISNKSQGFLKKIAQYLVSSKYKKQEKYLFYFIEKLYLINLEKNEKDRFIDIRNKLKEVELDYFLSFRNTNHTKGTILSINQEYQEFIIEKLGKSEYTEENIKANNLFAKAIHQKLKDKGLKGFFHPEHQDGSPVEKQINDNIKNSKYFIQLINNDIFKQFTEINYCHLEYLISEENLSFIGECKFLLCMKEHNDLEQLVAIEYDSWHSKINMASNPKLDNTDLSNLETTLNTFITSIKNWRLDLIKTI